MDFLVPRCFSENFTRKSFRIVKWEYSEQSCLDSKSVQSACNFGSKITWFCTDRVPKGLHWYLKSWTHPQNGINTLFLIQMMVIQRVTIVIDRNGIGMLHINAFAISMNVNRECLFRPFNPEQIIDWFVDKITCTLTSFWVKVIMFRVLSFHYTKRFSCEIFGEVSGN